MKKYYESPELEIVRLETSDVLTSSPSEGQGNQMEDDFFD